MIWQTCITLAAYKWDESKSLEAGRRLHVRAETGSILLTGSYRPVVCTSEASTQVERFSS